MTSYMQLILNYKYARGAPSIICILMIGLYHIIASLVSGNLGTGVAVMGAFSLVRFRSIPGDSRKP